MFVHVYIACNLLSLENVETNIVSCVLADQIKSKMFVVSGKRRVVCEFKMMIF